VFLERFRANVAAAFGAVARAPEGVVVIHCMGGKDRTGLLVALLLNVAGVDDLEIAADYAVSEERLRPRHESWLAEAGTEAERERIGRIAATPAASMLAVLEELERRYGSGEGYLRAGGLGDEELELVRKRLRG
jgi:protein tyrosine/serine phosphatase